MLVQRSGICDGRALAPGQSTTEDDLKIKIEDMIYSQIYNVKLDMQPIKVPQMNCGLSPLLLQIHLLAVRVSI
jgi:hypothetical protein